MAVRDIQMKYTIDNPKPVRSWLDPEENDFTGVVKDKYGNIAYFENGYYHREDGPAIIHVNGNKEWFFNGKIHREDGPAIECSYGDKAWLYNNKRYGFDDDFTVESWVQKWKLEIFK